LILDRLGSQSADEQLPPIDRQTSFLVAPSVDDWLPEKHLARFVVELIDGLDLSMMSGAYRGSGSASYHPRLCWHSGVWLRHGIFSSRKLERATYDLWRSASSPPTIIPITIPSPHSGGGF